jgi:hypothetical protein
VISLQVGDCWLWSLIIFLFHRSLFSAMFIPHEDCTPQNIVHPSTCGGGGLQGGDPPRMGVRGTSGERGEILKEKFLVNVYCNFIVNLDHSL